MGVAVAGAAGVSSGWLVVGAAVSATTAGGAVSSRVSRTVSIAGAGSLQASTPARLAGMVSAVASTPSGAVAAVDLARSEAAALASSWCGQISCDCVAKVVCVSSVSGVGVGCGAGAVSPTGPEVVEALGVGTSGGMDVAGVIEAVRAGVSASTGGAGVEAVRAEASAATGGAGVVEAVAATGGAGVVEAVAATGGAGVVEAVRAGSSATTGGADVVALFCEGAILYSVAVGLIVSHFACCWPGLLTAGFVEGTAGNRAFLEAAS